MMTKDKNYWFDLEGKVVVITGGAGLLGFQHGEAIDHCGGIAVHFWLRTHSRFRSGAYDRDRHIGFHRCYHHAHVGITLGETHASP